MLVIETWPDPARGSAPRVRAAADPAILPDLAETTLDMLVWGRRVPLVWQEELERCDPPPGDEVSLEGTLDAVTAGLRAAARRLRYPAFLMEDVEQTVALVAALAFSNRLSLWMRPVPPEGMALPGVATALRLACCYGGVLDWVSGRSFVSDEISSVPPYALAFLPPWSAMAVAPRFVRHGGPAIGLMVGAA